MTSHFKYTIVLIIGIVAGWNLKAKEVGYVKVPEYIKQVEYKVIKIQDPSNSTNTNTRYVPPEGSVTISPKDPSKTINDVVNIKVKAFGFCRSLGISYSPINHALAVDDKFFFFGRFGVVAGLAFSKAELNDYAYSFGTGLSPILGGTYRLDKLDLFKNTELIFGYAPMYRVPLYGGVRLNF